MGYREKMSRELRAKQFMPFAALKGHSEALREMERIPAPRKEFSEEYQEELDRGLRQIRRNDAIRIVYYADGEYREVIGNVSGIDQAEGTVTVGDNTIPVRDICEVVKIPV